MIALALLREKLIVCAKQIAVQSDFVWKDKVETSNEVLLLMDSREDLFVIVEAEVAKHHSYETFVLVAVPLIRISHTAEEWMNKNLKKPGSSTRPGLSAKI